MSKIKTLSIDTADMEICEMKLKLRLFIAEYEKWQAY